MKTKIKKVQKFAKKETEILAFYKKRILRRRRSKEKNYNLHLLLNRKLSCIKKTLYKFQLKQDIRNKKILYKTFFSRVGKSTLLLDKKRTNLLLVLYNFFGRTRQFKTYLYGLYQQQLQQKNQKFLKNDDLFGIINRCEKSKKARRAFMFKIPVGKLTGTRALYTKKYYRHKKYSLFAKIRNTYLSSMKRQISSYLHYYKAKRKNIFNISKLKRKRNKQKLLKRVNYIALAKVKNEKIFLQRKLKNLQTNRTILFIKP